MDAHNSQLQIAAELGWAGLAAHLIAIAATFVMLGRAPRGATASTGGLEAALAAYFVCSLFGSFQYSWVLHYLIGLSVGASASAEPERLRGDDPWPAEIAR
jgi:hypothetical protein